MLSPRNLLFVDDHPFIVRGLVGYLYKLDREATAGVAYTVASAAMQLNKEPQKFHAAVIDYRLPDNNGLVLIDWIRRKYPRIATVLYASDVDDETARKALKLGAVAVLPKEAASDETFTELYRALGWPMPQRLVDEQADFGRFTVPGGLYDLPQTPSQAKAAPPVEFEPREALVLALIMNGKSNKEIARATGMSIATVKSDVAKLLRWGGTESRSALGAHAYGQGITPAKLERLWETQRAQ